MCIRDRQTGDSKQYSIEVSNGGNIIGYAAKTQERLNGLGYNVTKITTWYGTQDVYKRQVFIFSAVFVLAATAFKSQRDKQEALNSSGGGNTDAAVSDDKMCIRDSISACCCLRRIFLREKRYDGYGKSTETAGRYGKL